MRLTFNVLRVGFNWLNGQGSVARSGSVGSIIFQKSSEAKRPGSVCYIYIYIYIYIYYIERQIIMKTCIFVYILHLYSKKICRKTN
jgi:hypothetical protein